MRKKITVGIVVAILTAPLFASADTNQSQLISLYQQLIQLLQQEITLLQSQSLSVSPTNGSAPLAVTYTVTKALGNESIDFGDGHSTGSAGCVKNMQGFCDLSKPIIHSYLYPGSYTVTLYRNADPNATVVTTQTVTVK